MRRPLALLGSRWPPAPRWGGWLHASRLPDATSSMMVELGPADAAMSVLRAVALGAAAYLTVVALLHLLVPTWSGARRWVSVSRCRRSTRFCHHHARGLERRCGIRRRGPGSPSPGVDRTVRPPLVTGDQRSRGRVHGEPGDCFCRSPRSRSPHTSPSTVDHGARQLLAARRPRHTNAFVHRVSRPHLPRPGSAATGAVGPPRCEEAARPVSRA